MKLYLLIFSLLAAISSLDSISPNIAGALDMGQLMQETGNTNASQSPAGQIDIDVYMESQCPDTTKFLKNQLLPVFDELKDFMNLNVIPFGKANWTRLTTTNEEDYSFECQHGPKECLVNAMMCCGIERLKSVEKYLPYIACLQGTSPGNEEQEKCDGQAGLHHNEMQACANGTRGRVLLHRMGEITQGLDPPLTFIPWIVVNGTREKRALMELKAVVCQKLNETFSVKPHACDYIPPPPPTSGAHSFMSGSLWAVGPTLMMLACFVVRVTRCLGGCVLACILAMPA